MWCLFFFPSGLSLVANSSCITSRFTGYIDYAQTCVHMCAHLLRGQTWDRSTELAQLIVQVGSVKPSSICGWNRERTSFLTSRKNVFSSTAATNHHRPSARAQLLPDVQNNASPTGAGGSWDNHILLGQFFWGAEIGHTTSTFHGNTPLIPPHVK